MREITVLTKPAAKKIKVNQLGKNNYAVWLTAPAVQNKANSQLIKVLSKHFKTRKSHIVIKSGLLSKYKKVFVQ